MKEHGNAVQFNLIEIVLEFDEKGLTEQIGEILSQIAKTKPELLRQYLSYGGYKELTSSELATIFNQEKKELHLNFSSINRLIVVLETLCIDNTIEFLNGLKNLAKGI